VAGWKTKQIPPSRKLIRDASNALRGRRSSRKNNRDAPTGVGVDANRTFKSGGKNRPLRSG
jgi:hypothetical protein